MRKVQLLLSFAALFCVLISCSEAGALAKQQDSKKCNENKINRLSLNDKFQLDISNFQTKDIKALKTTYSTHDFDTKTKQTCRGIQVYIANYTISTNGRGTVIYDPSEPGQYLLKIEYQGTTVPEGEQPKINTGAFTPMAIDEKSNHPKATLTLTHQNQPVFSKVLKMVANVKGGTAQLQKLTEKQVCGDFKLEIDGKLDIDLSFDAPIINEAW